jgi:hypothetical protein
METGETKNQNKNGTGNKSGNEIKDQNRESESGDEYIKVTVSKKAEKAMGDLLVRVNDGFDGGRVNRQDLISWILAKFADECTDQEIRTIRADHFDEIMLLELSLKKFKQAGGLPPELKKMLLSQAGLEDFGKRNAKKSVDNKVNQ